MITILLKKIIEQLNILKVNIIKAKGAGLKSNYVEIKSAEYTSTNL